MATPAQPLPAQAPPPQTLAQSIRAKYPGTYDDMDDATLESKILQKYPQYSDMPRTQPKALPVTNQMSAAPSELAHIGEEVGNITHAGINSKFPWIHPLDALGAGLNAASAETIRNAPSPVTQLLLGGQAAGQRYGTSSGLLNNPVTQAMAGAVPLPWTASKAAEVAEDPATRGAISQGYNAAKNAVGNFMRDPVTGKLKPLTRELARAGGAAAGYGMGKDSGHGMEGMLIGGVAGPGIADALIPASQTARAAQTAAQLSKATAQAQKDALAAGRNAPGPWHPGEARAAYKQSITPQPQVVPAGAEPTFSGSEGRAATWTNEDVMRLASQGNRDAISQAIRRGLQLPPNARYVMGSPDYPRAVYNPRETTTFEPESTPIRNKANPKAGQPSPNKKLVLPWAR